MEDILPSYNILTTSLELQYKMMFRPFIYSDLYPDIFIGDVSLHTRTVFHLLQNKFIVKICHM